MVNNSNSESLQVTVGEDINGNDVLWTLKNNLFISGIPGTGKTHLLHKMLKEIAGKTKKMQTFYINRHAEELILTDVDTVTEMSTSQETFQFLRGLNRILATRIKSETQTVHTPIIIAIDDLIPSVPSTDKTKMSEALIDNLLKQGSQVGIYFIVTATNVESYIPLFPHFEDILMFRNSAYCLDKIASRFDFEDFPLILQLKKGETYFSGKNFIPYPEKHIILMKS